MYSFRMITDTELELTAELAQIEMSPEEAETLRAAVSRIIEYFATMAEVDVDGLPPMTHVNAAENRVRSDRSEPWSDTEGLLEKAGDLEDRFIAVPNVL